MSRLPIAPGLARGTALVARAAVLLVCLAAPVLAVPAMTVDASRTIEAPTMKKRGIGLVLLVSLQRE